MVYNLKIVFLDHKEKHFLLNNCAEVFNKKIDCLE